MIEVDNFDGNNRRVYNLLIVSYGFKQICSYSSHRFVNFMKKRKLDLSIVGLCLFINYKYREKLPVIYADGDCEK